MMLIKVPRWLSEIWLSCPEEAAVADLDLERGKLLLRGDTGGRPSSFVVERRASPELFAFPVCREGEEVPVEGGISDALSITPDFNDGAYKSMVQHRQSSAVGTSKRSKLEEKLIPLNRGDFLAGEAAQRGAAGGGGGEEGGGQLAEAMDKVWQAVQQCLRSNPEGVTCDELLRQLPPAPAFLTVRNALAAIAEPIEVDGQRRFVMRRRTAEELKVEFKMEGGSLQKREQKKEEVKNEQPATPNPAGALAAPVGVPGGAGGVKRQGSQDTQAIKQEIPSSPTLPPSTLPPPPHSKRPRL
mmetsp:Transcript_114581/g.296929  ORF Transcript_114581/g.296929 Transcript_114581/m.296929 type:complete len:299 (+) Transcript_114581:3-899(+)